VFKVTLSFKLRVREISAVRWEAERLTLGGIASQKLDEYGNMKWKKNQFGGRKLARPSTMRLPALLNRRRCQCM